METDADNRETEVVGRLEEMRDRIQRCTKLEPQTTEALRVVGQDPHNEPCIRIDASNLVKLVGIVERHGIDPRMRSRTDERDGLAGIGKDDPGQRVDWNTELENLLDLAMRSAIEADSQRCKQTKNVRVWVAFDSYSQEKSRQVASASEPEAIRKYQRTTRKVWSSQYRSFTS
jgi:hypothetical protein